MIRPLSGKSTGSVDLSPLAIADLWNMSQVYPCEFQTHFPRSQVGNCWISWFYYTFHLIGDKSLETPPPTTTPPPVDGGWLSLHIWSPMDICFRAQEKDIGISKTPGISQSGFSPSQFPRTPLVRHVHICCCMKKKKKKLCGQINLENIALNKIIEFLRIINMLIKSVSL